MASFTFFYCMLHDDGFIIEGQHSYVPADYVMAHSDKCDVCDWCQMGVISYTSLDPTTSFGSTSFGSTTEFEILERITFDYDRYGGGYSFRMYEQTLTDVKGCPVDNEALDAWIREMAL
jgi:hypothetical protein